ncbi:MAG: prolipoprotein diacylglyceryl transferase [Verrucomicrobiia bacterium]
MTSPIFQNTYGWVVIVSLWLSVFLWFRIARNNTKLFIIFIISLIGAVLGAKIVYLTSEGWLHWSEQSKNWRFWLTGKSVLGALLGGYLGVEIAKYFLKYKPITGDQFAQIVPLSIALGRLGCLFYGCCQGRICTAPAWFNIYDSQGHPRFPSVPLEIAFNLMAALFFLLCRKRQWFIHQHFHLYLIAYGLFRFFHEFFRETPVILSIFTGYQVWAAILAVFGIIRFYQRTRQFSPKYIMTHH